MSVGVQPAKKVQIFSNCVISKLMYSLHTEWFGKADIANWMLSKLGVSADSTHPTPVVRRVTNEHTWFFDRRTVLNYPAFCNNDSCNFWGVLHSSRQRMSCPSV